MAARLTNNDVGLGGGLLDHIRRIQIAVNKMYVGARVLFLHQLGPLRRTDEQVIDEVRVLLIQLGENVSADVP